jgi:sialate O-acetylesterase
MSRSKSKSLAAIIVMVMAMSSALAEVRPHPLFSNNAVLQQGMAVPVWGKADPGEKVTVKFLEQEVSTVTGADGKWMVRLQPLKAGGPYTMRINDQEIRDVLVGEVWICSGQSNMDFPLQRAETAERDIPGSRDYSLRWLLVPRVPSDTPLDWFESSWQVCRPSAIPDMTAVGYYFARELRRQLGVPVGIIQSSVGGTRSEWWTPRTALEANPVFKAVLEDQFNEQIEPTRHPGVLYNAMIAPLEPYAIRGVVWYQGESNKKEGYNYRIALPTLIRTWREAWGQGDFPFLFAQLPRFQKIQTEPKEDTGWAVARESQLITAQTIPNTGMAVIIDTGEEKNIHPTKKEPVGARLSLVARALVYGQDVVYSGPVYKSMRVQGDSIVLSFDHIHGGLVAKDGPLTGFAVAGEDRKWAWADAKIVGDRIVLRSSKVPHPVAARFGWADFPLVNLYNAEGLPASPFRTDTWPVATQPGNK